MDSSSSGGGDDRWKLSNKGRSRSGRPHAMAMATDDASSAVLSRSYSASVVSSSSSSRSTQAQAAESSSHSRLSKKKCVEAVKEHRARFYIVRRCVSMLVCWRDY